MIIQPNSIVDTNEKIGWVRFRDIENGKKLPMTVSALNNDGNFGSFTMKACVDFYGERFSSTAEIKVVEFSDILLLPRIWQVTLNALKRHIHDQLTNKVYSVSNVFTQDVVVNTSIGVVEV